ncbi:hypothetical protein KLEP7_gp45 [Pseudaeromonas phage vB_PpeM_ KLEP7]|nr:hypothetical protein KLEP7_gp45 [Pseudaeromonas phage vB_PpeM_ KLEP7]
MSNIIQVDFKTKQIIKDYKQYQWIDALSGESIDFDSRREDNVSRVPLVVFVKHNNELLRVTSNFKPQDLIEVGKELSEIKE